MKLYKGEYRRALKPVLFKASPARYLSIGGSGEVDGAFGDLTGHLYNMAYTIKMASKKAGFDYKVCPLEARYWTQGQAGPYDFAQRPMDEWQWQVMVRTPLEIGEADLSVALDVLLGKGKSEVLREVELIDLDEGVCAQVLHVGPYSESKRSTDLLVAMGAVEGLVPIGSHHEIYLSDPRRVPPERLKTLLRLPLH